MTYPVETGKIQTIEDEIACKKEEMRVNNTSNRRLHKRSFWRSVRQEIKNNWLLFVMLIPAIAYVIIFAYWPMTGVVLAFKDFKTRLGIYGSPWVGMQNFKFLQISGKLGMLTRNTLLYNLAFIVLGVILEMGFAIILNEVVGRKFKKGLQTIMFLPYFISWVVVSAIMFNMFNYEKGTINNLLSSLGAQRFDLYNSTVLRSTRCARSFWPVRAWTLPRMKRSWIFSRSIC